MDIFLFRNQLVNDYSSYVKSFIEIRDPFIREYVGQSLDAGALWPEPLIQLNPAFEPGAWVDDLVGRGILHDECARVFRIKPDANDDGRALRLHKHQSDAIQTARGGHNYVLTTGTASGKSLSYIVPIVDHVLQRGSRRGIQAIVVYPMNALANSQHGELKKFLQHGYPDGKGPVTFARYTGQESNEDRRRIMESPPDILLTNYVMLELILTRPYEHPLIYAAQNLKYLVLDELHTYRGRQGADVALLVRRVRDRLSAEHLQCVGTSATIAGKGSFEEQRIEVAAVASQLFGADVNPEHVIGETLRRATPEMDLKDAHFMKLLAERVADPNLLPPLDFESFIKDPLSVWIESTFGLSAEPGTNRLIRSKPRMISGKNGAARDLSLLTGITLDRCVESIQTGLLGGYKCSPNPETGFPPFAFRLHQFISRGDTVYATLEREDKRYLTVYGQQYQPGERDHVLLPLVFCRECGQEYYCVRGVRDTQTGRRTFVPRQLTDQLNDGSSEPGFLYISTSEPWPIEPQEIIRKLPDDWIEEHQGAPRVRQIRRNDLPQPTRFDTAGYEAEQGIDAHYFSAPFRFCLHCGVSYGFRQTDDFAKLASLGSEGRSTATTILSLSAVRNLRRESTLEEKARKLLSFTDNRQDASLQAGHFNDFIEIGLLRSALYRAVREAGGSGLSHDELTQKVFDAFNLPFELYSSEPNLRPYARRESHNVLREVLGYRIYRDLKRGWRITSPNLEQCGLLEIRYPLLEDVCADEELWTGCHAALVGADPESRAKIAKVLLDFMRRELAIKVSYLEPLNQERIQQQSNQRLISPWAIDENEAMQHAAVLFPRSRARDDYRGNVYLSARGGFGQFLRRVNTFPNLNTRLSLDDTENLINDLLNCLRLGGLIEAVERDEDNPGYQLLADGMKWMAGDGTRAFHDPIRVPRESATGGRTNPFFIEFYRNMAADLHGLEAREHTAQVDYQLRLEREENFRQGRLPILYCSPTMELGVDISQLNVVSLRNVPPTPANYAQRSGRAGRSGQPALVFAYCSIGSPHDQYFFKRPELMVAGAVTPPRLDLTNEDLIRAHVHAIWLAETNQSLGKSLKDILDLSGEEPTLQLLDSVRDSMEAESPRRRAFDHAKSALASLNEELQHADWFTDRWLQEVLHKAAHRFDQSCERWRSLYTSALQQAKAQDRIIRDASRSLEDKKQAERLRREAESQLKILTEIENVAQSDFYSYRYFASEGFLPGYNFPRLPISAYIPGRKTRQRDEFLSRPRFLAISEFGPRSIIYHEGSRYAINKVILPVGDDDVTTYRAKVCTSCGYLHPVMSGEGQDLCERCGSMLDTPLQPLFRMQNVSTKRRDKINSDEEERIRLGYELITSVRFAEQGGQPSYRTATVEREGELLARFSYGQAATLWRINLGWMRRRNRNQYGFVLDKERGYWARNEEVSGDDQEDPMSARTARVIPYVEDTRNCMLFESAEKLSPAMMASLQAALKTAIQVEYQLEDNELASEPLPSVNDRRLILLYESAEGGAGVLRRLLDDPTALARVAAQALRLCHFDPSTGIDLRRAPGAQEDCEAACYDCLMSYYNQREHRLLDRQTIHTFLMQLSGSTVIAAPAAAPRADHLEQLMNMAGSELERSWLRFLEANRYRLPSKAQVFIESCQTRPDFLYEEQQAAIYIDGPHHAYPERRERDRLQSEWLEDQGYTVIRFDFEDEWERVVDKYPDIFGARQVRRSDVGTSTTPQASDPDIDLFDPRWHRLIRTLLEQLDEIEVEAGSDVMHNNRVVGAYLAEVAKRGRKVRLIDGDALDVEMIEQALSEQGVRTVRISDGNLEATIAQITSALEEDSHARPDF